jgi:hypothetical protein
MLFTVCARFINIIVLLKGILSKKEQDTKNKLENQGEACLYCDLRAMPVALEISLLMRVSPHSDDGYSRNKVLPSVALGGVQEKKWWDGFKRIGLLLLNKHYFIFL